MAAIDASRSLGALVIDRPDLARELERLGLDYCCGGDRSLTEACRDAGLDAARVAEALAAIPTREPESWATMGPGELVDHLESTHHAFLHAELPRLVALCDKVTAAHGARHPELVDVGEVLRTLRAELELHLAKEERVLFPMIRELITGGAIMSSHCGSVRNPISVMLAEHDQAGELLARLRTLTHGCAPPADACASYELLYRGLAELEADTHQHVHKENSRLFPAVIERERELSLSA